MPRQFQLLKEKAAEKIAGKIQSLLFLALKKKKFKYPLGNLHTSQTSELKWVVPAESKLYSRPSVLKLGRTEIARRCYGTIDSFLLMGFTCQVKFPKPVQIVLVMRHAIPFS